MGDGVLEIDVLNETCQFNTKEIGQLSIAGALRSWLLQDLETSKIPIMNIESAKLIVRLRAGFDKRGGVLNYNHDFSLEGIMIGKGREFKTKLEDKNGHQKIIET